MNKVRLQRFRHMLIDFVLFVLAFVIANVIFQVPLADFVSDGMVQYGNGWLFAALYYAAFAGIFVMCCLFLNAYSVLWQFATWVDYARLVVAAASSAVFNYVLFKSLPGEHLAVCILFAGALGCVFTAAHRVIWVLLTKHADKKTKTKIGGNVMIIGAGSAGALLIRDFMSRSHSGKVVCAIDDDPHKVNQTVLGVRIVGTRQDIVSAAKRYAVKTIVLAVPSGSSKNRAEILNLCQKTDCEIRLLPTVDQLVGTEVSVNSVRKVQIEDLLGRDPIKIDVDKIMSYVSGETVLVTGGGGSIGSELCRQIAAHQPKQLIILDIYENSAYDIQNELKRQYPELDLITLIGSVRDSRRLNQVFEKYHPTLVFHAAAHKHVPLMENSPNESIKNNVIGTLKLAKTADQYGVKTFVLISTDKAVNPTNIMGASKRICEMIVQSFSRRSETKFVAVRFGNVLGSNGSVIPLFEKQISEGGPVTVTDPNIIRYFMTIPEAVSLVLQAGAQAHGGEIFVLDMGEPVRILDLAENMIRLSGYTPYEDIPIVFTGLRPGEKLYEELLMDEEGLQDTENRLIHIGKPLEFDDEQFYRDLDQLQAVMYDDKADVRDLVHKIVPTYHYKK